MLLMLALLMSVGGTSAQGVDSDAASRCMDFGSDGRLKHGVAWSLRLPHDLEVRLSPEGAAASEASYRWNISAGPHGEARDFLWVVSPPFQTAPHRVIGAAYGLTARQSVEISRKFRFVLTTPEYDEALAVVEGEAASEQKIAKLERLGKGSLTLKVTKYELRDGIETPFGVIDGLEWIEFTGRACVPANAR
jgi:hypothetical protein